MIPSILLWQHGLQALYATSSEQSIVYVMGKLESLPGIIWKLWNLPAEKFTAKQLYCWNSDKSTPVYDFENRARCMQLNILYTVTQPPGGCIIESVYFDWHISFFFSSRHYCCKWYLCSIWIFSSKKLVRYLDKHLLNKVLLLLCWWFLEAIQQ